MAVLSKFLEFINGGIKISRLFGRGYQSSLEIWYGDIKIPRRFGRGYRIPYSQGGSKYPSLAGCIIS